MERADIRGAWQFPQGGLGEGEKPLEAVIREIQEETGIGAEDLELLATFPEPLAYELTIQGRSERTGRGQVLYWFLFRFGGDDSAIDVDRGGEFCGWKWISFDRLIDQVVAFRKGVYKRLENRFEYHIKGF